MTFYPAGRDRLAALLGLIASAKTSIRMCFYIFAKDVSGAAVRDALSEAARRGVAVDLLLDGFGADAGEDFFAPMCEAGGRYSCFSAKWSQRYLIRNHQKIERTTQPRLVTKRCRHRFAARKSVLMARCRADLAIVLKPISPIVRSI